jgi:hypothetical protein
VLTIRFLKVPFWVYSSAMATNVKFKDEFVQKARQVAKAEHRSVPSQIEFYFKIALIAEQNPEMSFKLIKEILHAQSEEANEEYVFGE